jgi:hypothetical protein
MKRLAVLVLFLAVPAEAKTVVVVPRTAPIVRPMPRVVPTARPNVPRATTSTYSWWPWSGPAKAPCKKDKNGKCRK